MLSSPPASSLKHVVKPSCERCAPYTCSRGAASSPKMREAEEDPSRQALLSPQVTALTSHPQALTLLHRGPPAPQQAQKYAGLLALVSISSLRLHLRENIQQTNVCAFLLLLFLSLQFSHSARDPKRVKESRLLSYRRNQTKIE